MVGRTRRTLWLITSVVLLVLLLNQLDVLVLVHHQTILNIHNAPLLQAFTGSKWNGSGQTQAEVTSAFQLNNYGDNDDLVVSRTRHQHAEDIKYILFWNEAYGTKEYDFGFGRTPFYTNLCPETRCVTTENRSLMAVEDFDAILFHQRSLNWKDVPARRSAKQRYIHFIMESAQYLYMDISSMNNFFNWTMTYRRDSDFFRPYGRVFQVKEHPTGEALDQFIREFGRKNKHLAAGKNRTAAWFVSHCATQARRELYVKKLKKQLDVDVYGKCGKLKCPRTDEAMCYNQLETNYKFYLSFENSLCEDYVTEKYFRILKYNVVPITFNGADMSQFGPQHSSINALDFKSVSSLIEYLKKVMDDDELYSSYFWWKEFYHIRDSRQDLSQAFCSVCSALHSESETKIYSNLHRWWVDKSRCRKLKLT